MVWEPQEQSSVKSLLCLPSLGGFLKVERPGMVAHACILNIWEVETEGSEVKIDP